MTTSEAGSSRRIQDDHRSIRDLLAALGGTDRVGEVLGLMEELRGMLETHFAFEESEGGMRAVVAEQAPERMPELEVLFVEHGQLRGDVQRLWETAQDCLRLRDALIGRIKRHEAQEAELLSSALYDDIGGSG
jgi:hypothetical protein